LPGQFPETLTMIKPLGALDQLNLFPISRNHSQPVSGNTSRFPKPYRGSEKRETQPALPLVTAGSIIEVEPKHLAEVVARIEAQGLRAVTARCRPANGGPTRCGWRQDAPGHQRAGHNNVQAMKTRPRPFLGAARAILAMNHV
jgi:hypothetical protein